MGEEDEADEADVRLHAREVQCEWVACLSVSASINRWIATAASDQHCAAWLIRVDNDEDVGVEEKEEVGAQARSPARIMASTSTRAGVLSPAVCTDSDCTDAGRGSDVDGRCGRASKCECRRRLALRNTSEARCRWKRSDQVGDKDQRLDDEVEDDDDDEEEEGDDEVEVEVVVLVEEEVEGNDEDEDEEGEEGERGAISEKTTYF